MNMYQYNVKISKVVDGDTVDVDIDLGFSTVLKKQRVRLMGIDTPESRTRDLVEKKFGKAAGIIRNKQIVEDADFCIIFWDGKSKGTKNTIDLCNKLHKKYRLITFEN